MKRSFSARIFAAVLGGVLLITILAHFGCNAEQVGSTAEQVRYVAGGPAATQPFDNQAALDAARAAANAASGAFPLFGTISSIVALVAGAVAGIARGQRSERKNAHTVIDEILSDVKEYREDNVPWTETTRTLLIDLGYAKDAEPIVAEKTVSNA